MLQVPPPGPGYHDKPVEWRLQVVRHRLGN